jgi:hypothetical protein
MCRIMHVFVLGRDGSQYINVKLIMMPMCIWDLLLTCTITKHIPFAPDLQVSYQ